MKKLKLFLCLLLSLVGIQSVWGQCPIEGPDDFVLGQTTMFSTLTAPGVGHFWSATGNIKIESGSSNSEVTVSGSCLGTGRLCVTSFVEGFDPCCNCIDVTVTDGQDDIDCSITGPSTFRSDQTASYFTAAGVGLGHFWSTSGVVKIDVGGNGSGITISATGSGSGRVCVTSYAEGEEPCCNCINVTVTDPPPPCIIPNFVSVFQDDSQSGGCPGTTFNYDAFLSPSNATTGIGSFFWEAGTGLIAGQNIFFTKTTTNPTVNIPNMPEGNVWVRVTFTSPCDGSTYDSETIATYRSDCPGFTDGQPDRLLDNDSANKVRVKVHPNPFRDQLTFEVASAEAQEVQLDLYDSQGKLLLSRRLDLAAGAQHLQIEDLPRLAKGLLYYRLHGAGRTLSNGELIHLE